MMNSIVSQEIPDGVQMTSGGRFDRTDAPVYFIAAGPDKVMYIPEDERPQYVLVAVNEVETNASLNRLRTLIGDGTRILLDSGVFALTNEHARKYGVKMDAALALAPSEIQGFDDLYRRYCTLVEDLADDLWGVIEIDQGGADNKRATRERLMRDLPGFVPMPVYHPVNDGSDYFTELAEGYDRICAGNVVQATYHDRVRLLRLFYEQRRDHPHLWIHALGYTPTGTTASTPIPSCDSSSWVTSLRWPAASKIRAMMMPLKTAQIGQDLVYARGGDVVSSDRGGHLDGYRWSAYTTAATFRTWRLIEAEKERLGLGERHIR